MRTLASLQLTHIALAVSALIAGFFIISSFSLTSPKTHAELGFYSLSPMGEAGGKIIPASCPSNPHADGGYGPCVATNACGQSNSGVYQCGGAGGSAVCSAAAPALPAGYGTTCTPANACGQAGVPNSGTIGCDGRCHGQLAGGVSNYGVSCQSVGANACGMHGDGIIGCDGQCTASVPSDNLCTSAGPAQCTVAATPSQVFKNSKTILAWSSSGATSCTITGRSAYTNQVTQTFGGLPGSGTVTTDTMTEDTIFNMVCTNARGSCDAGDYRVRVINLPSWIEF